MRLAATAQPRHHRWAGCGRAGRLAHPFLAAEADAVKRPLPASIPRALWPALLAALLALPAPALAASALVAVAANFATATAALQPRFEARTGHELTVALGSTGQLAAQIQRGAPFDAFLAADAARPALLAQSGHALAGTQFPYALGRLMLWSPDPAAFADDAGAAWLRTGRWRHLAIANPALAPYGAAATQTLRALALWQPLDGRLVRGNDVGQVYALVVSGAAEAGFIARAQLAADTPGSRWLVPARLHQPLAQEAILLRHGQHNPAARAWLDYLRSPPARAVIAGLGYDLPPP